MSAEPTAADLERARGLGLHYGVDGEYHIAAAIAAAREEGRREAEDLRQRVEALAEEIAGEAAQAHQNAKRLAREGSPGWAASTERAAGAKADAADRLRAAVAPAQPAEEHNHFTPRRESMERGVCPACDAGAAQPVTRTTPIEEPDDA